MRDDVEANVASALVYCHVATCVRTTWHTRVHIISKCS